MNIEWSPDIEVGVEEIDAQHREILLAAAEISRAYEHSGTLPSLQTTVDFLIGHVTSHFACEERLMRESGYPGYEAHRVEHRALLKDLVKFGVAHDEGDSGRKTAEAVVQLLVVWVHRHIFECDRELATFLRARAAPPAPDSA